MNNKIKGRKWIHHGTNEVPDTISQNPDNSQQNINSDSSSNESSLTPKEEVSYSFNFEFKRTRTPVSDNNRPKTPIPDNKRQKTPASKTKNLPVKRSWCKKSPYYDKLYWAPLIFLFFNFALTKYNQYVERTDSDQPHIFPEPEICKKSFKQLREAHPEQDSLVLSSLFHSASMVPKGEVSVLVLMYKNSNGEFFIEEMLKTTQKCIGKSDPIILNRYSFTPEMEEDYGIALVDHGRSLNDSYILLVNDIDSIPASAAPAFHQLCDVHNPYVKPAIIFFTLKYNRLDDDSGDRTATNILKSKWSVLEDNVLEALITRVTDQVLVIR